jgi:hypothetical protein
MMDRTESMTTSSVYKVRGQPGNAETIEREQAKKEQRRQSVDEDILSSARQKSTHGRREPPHEDK